MGNKVIVDLEQIERKLKPNLMYNEWIKVYEFLSNCEEYED